MSTLASPEIAPRTENAEAARRRMIAERQKTSVTWRIIHWLGSLQLALILLATIAIACAIATFYESSFSAKVAQAYIYKAPWFVLWLGVLCTNLFAVTLTRWPWQRKHAGFIITHYGIIVLLIGAIIGLHFGFEGNVTLHKDKPPVRKLTVNRSIIQVESPTDSALYVMPFDASTARLSERNPRTFPVPGTDLRIVTNEFHPNLVTEEKIVEGPGGVPAMMVRFSSKRLDQELAMPLLLEGSDRADADFFGLATVSLRKDLPPPVRARPSETQMVFGRYAPVVQSESEASGVRVILSADGAKVTLESDDLSTTYRTSEILNKPLTIGAATVTVEGYWPDFEMRDGRPATKSDVPNNPAALVRVATAQADAASRPALLLAPSGDGVDFQLQSEGATYASGKARVGEPFALGWADWQAEIVTVTPSGVKASVVKPGPELEKGENGIPGFLARLESPDGPPGEWRWVPSGEVTALTDGRRVIRIGYGLELRPVPFSIRLVNFEVPRYEGTETPSNFIASVEFQDAASGETKTGTARMNHPASFPGTLWANLTGFNYKFSQAEWNPKDLGETTLQVLYDPGWSLKWIGSLGICIGITMLFYGKPRKRRDDEE